MATVSALEFLRARARAAELPAAVAIYGPQPFLREYVLDAALERLAGAARERVRLEMGPNSSPAALLAELSSGGLFARARVVICRVLRARRARAHGADEEDDAASSRGADAQLAQAIATLAPALNLLMLYEHERLPASLGRAVESCGLAIVCGKPFPNQMAQYARQFAHKLKLELSADACAYLVERCNIDLGAIHNALALLAIELGPGAKVGMKEVDRPLAGFAPELFELARCVSAGEAGRFLALLERALGLGRDPVEVLAVEMIPTLRRMMLAASMLTQGRGRAEIARAMGMAPQSIAVESALDGAARLGPARIKKAYDLALELDAAFKTGLVRERESALCRLMLELA